MLKKTEFTMLSLQSWCDTCDTMLANIDQLITRANSDKEKHLKHRNSLEAEVSFCK